MSAASKHRKELITSGWIRRHCRIPQELLHIIQSFHQNTFHWLMDNESFKNIFSDQWTSRYGIKPLSLPESFIIDGVKFRINVHPKYEDTLFFKLQIVETSLLPNTMSIKVACSSEGNVVKARIYDRHFTYDCRKRHTQKEIEENNDNQYIDAEDDKYLFCLKVSDSIIN